MIRSGGMVLLLFPFGHDKIAETACPFLGKQRHWQCEQIVDQA
jgi:hypothetical protein